jgi:predicted permease
MFQDVRFGLKLLWKEKAFTFAALMTLALCIGANTAIFTILKAIILEPLPYPESHRMVTIFNVYPGVGVTDFGSNSVPDYFDRKEMKDVFDSVAVYRNMGFDLGAQGTASRIEGARVTPSYFNVIRTNAALGRTFTEDDAQPGKDRYALLTHGLWKEMFNSDPAIAGKDIRLNGVPYQVVGVLSDRYRPVGQEIRVFVPAGFTPKDAADDNRHSNNWEMIARLAPGVSLEQARHRIDALNAANLDRVPRIRKVLEEARFGTKVLSLKDELVKEARPLLFLIQAAVGFVLLIGCVNVANLMLVRANVRMKELAIRFSLGADRWRLSRQLLTESLVIAMLSGILGVVLGYGAVRWFSTLELSQMPSGFEFRMDSTVLGLSAGVALLTGFIFGLIPVFHVIRRDLNETFRSSGRTGTSDRGALWTRSALVVSQVAIAFVLLVGAGLLTVSFVRLLNVNPGFKPENVLTARINLPDVRYGDQARSRTFVRSLMERVRAIPGVKHAGVTSLLPFSGNNNASAITIDGYQLGPGELPPVPAYNSIDGGYLDAIGIPVLQGRGITMSDGPDAPKVILIDEYLAKRYWPKGDALGHAILRGLGDDEVKWNIVGVVPSIKTGNLAGETIAGQIYFPIEQFGDRALHIVVKTQTDDAQVTSAVRRLVAESDPELAVFDVKTMPKRLSASVSNRRAAMVVLLSFACVALLLSAIGIYGVLAYSVTQRTREFGIRVALGAGVRDVLSMVLGQGLKLAAVGLLLGAAGAFALTRLMSTMLYEVTASDPRVFVSVAIVLAAIAGVASLIPSLRALRIRPAEALRSE